MKNIIISFAIFVVVMLSALFSIRYLNSVCIKLEGLSMQIENNVQSDEWNKAYDNSLKFLNEWDKYSKKVSVFTHHAEIDNINNELWKLTQYTKEKNKDESLASAHVIKFLLKHIVEMEKVNPQNIF
ncbi:DUF4363 family protein [Clostridium sp. OS1-26]|uniref:DUF4363 family protein n=1 Tax=Clostridium sp. OS1-26 TaxID=3070681 RepID=UPI0027DFD0D0|nr:DUF4363 family protein [Clostridium sp. OS1-26]WML36643.1 DUF4363 family protein [Clostridium sp. OS1-26]